MLIAEFEQPNYNLPPELTGQLPAFLGAVTLPESEYAKLVSTVRAADCAAANRLALGEGSMFEGDCVIPRGDMAAIRGTVVTQEDTGGGTYEVTQLAIVEPAKAGRIVRALRRVRGQEPLVNLTAWSIPESPHDPMPY